MLLCRYADILWKIHSRRIGNNIEQYVYGKPDNRQEVHVGFWKNEEKSICDELYDEWGIKETFTFFQ